MKVNVVTVASNIKAACVKSAKVLTQIIHQCVVWYYWKCVGGTVYLC